jgi:hypothetical protein
MIHFIQNATPNQNPFKHMILLHHKYWQGPPSGAFNLFARIQEVMKSMVSLSALSVSDERLMPLR